MDRTFDRIPQFDERSRRFAAVDLLTTPELRSYTWSCDVYNDQGVEGACVGFAWSHELSARPKVFRADENVARAIYHRAQQIDEWPGTDYEGTSVLAGAKVVQQMSGTYDNMPLIGEYRWAFGAEDAVRVLGRRGPLVLGINWWSGMYNPDPKGTHPTGEIVGGHAILAKGVRCVYRDPRGPKLFSNLDLDKSWVLLHNSWGWGWGFDGQAKLTVRDFDYLLRDNGEACIPLRRSR